MYTLSKKIMWSNYLLNDSQKFDHLYVQLRRDHIHISVFGLKVV